ncbi:DUF2334 domain-containing protein [Terribacillus saccharophilus]|uniref:DUF2334 domain-containing protein n=1 Tax=Terribacillus saccharophilus TaxID=361277 RepID=UPI002DC1FEE4|nr:DUF2334 domain-containing protein [Terribacillus saccharophilus]MEC0288909.1 DUF2334 domain-containing protein [Terribacillus saccharophilus]
MRKSYIVLLALITISVFILPSLTFAAEDAESVLIIYSKTDEEQIKDVRILETLVAQFRDNYKVIEDKDIVQVNLSDYEQVLYFGAGKKVLSENLLEALNSYNGPFYAISHNVEQFKDKMPWLNVNGEALVNEVQDPEKQGQSLAENRIVYDVTGNDAATLLTGNKVDGNESVPLLLHEDNVYYFAAQNLYNPFGEYISESFIDFFGEEGKGITKYLRLEDVHPMVDPDLLMDQAKYLKEKNIPYMIAVIPEYTNKGKKVHLADSPKLVKTLKYMQDNGASIVMHGYKHQYRSSETGEGFEFWDAENDRPIYQPSDEKAKQRSDFATDAEFEAFLAEGEEYERAYIENAIESGIEELVAHDLYPVAFEAPHYAISQQGYEIVSEHFSSYVGQLQLTDLTWQGEYAPSYESRPEFLHGMTLYPETLGYVEQGNDKAFDKMQDKIKVRSKYSQSYLSAFYHPYLGLEGLKEVVSNLNEVDGAWLNLKSRDNRVEVNDIRISTQGGEYQVEKPFLASDYERNLFIKKILIWSIPVLLFTVTLVIILIRKRKKKSISQVGNAS